jgi:transglutaminase-like putative cysteine protease
LWIACPPAGRTLNGPAPGPTRATLEGIPAGEAGAAATMRRMRQLVRDALRDPSQGMRELALSIIGRGGYVDQARAIQNFVQTKIRYVHDPQDLELVQTPQYTVQHSAGDCDDQAVLTSVLLEATGHPTRFAAVGLQGGPLQHVLTQTLIGTQWAGVETIIPKPLGWMPPYTSIYYLKV